MMNKIEKKLKMKDTNAMAAKGGFLIMSNRHEEGIKLLEQAIEMGGISAMVTLAIELINGTKTPRNYKRGKELLENVVSNYQYSRETPGN